MKIDKYDIKVREWEHSGKSVKSFQHHYQTRQKRDAVILRCEFQLVNL